MPGRRRHGMMTLEELWTEHVLLVIPREKMRVDNPSSIDDVQRKGRHHEGGLHLGLLRALFESGSAGWHDTALALQHVPWAARRCSRLPT